MRISGPGKFHRHSGAWRRYVRPAILEGRLQTSDGQTHMLQENKLSIEIGPAHIYVYHSYSYLNNGLLDGGRWYDVHLPLTSFALPENTFTMDLSNFPSDIVAPPAAPQPISVTLVFSPQSAKKLRISH